MTYLVLTGEYHADVTYLTAKCNELMDQRDAALVQVAALREDRDQWRQLVGHICATIPLADVVASTETGQKTVDYFKALQQRLTAAEQRNAEAENLLRETSAVLRGGECYGWEDNQADLIDEYIGTKPTESGETE